MQPYKQRNGIERVRDSYFLPSQYGLEVFQLEKLCQNVIFKDDSDYLAFKETTWLYSKFVYRSTFLCKPVPPHSQPIQICCTMITNMQTELWYHFVQVHNFTFFFRKRFLQVHCPLQHEIIFINLKKPS